MNQSMIAPAAILITTAGALVAFERSRRRRRLCCKCLIKSLSAYLSRDLEGVLDAPAASVTWQTAYSISGGMLGTAKRWRNALVFKQLAQLRAAMAPVDGSDIADVENAVRKLTKSALITMVRTPFAFVTPESYVRAVQTMLKDYVDVADQTHSLYADETAPLCGILLASVL